jgi:hypothetical protein
VIVAGRAVPALAGPLLPPYLAAHLARHRIPALLWFLDLATLWESLTEAERAESRAVARRAGLARYLDWGLGRVVALRDAASGDQSALRRLGMRGYERRGVHPVFRDLALAPDALSACLAAGGWLFPRPLRASPGQLARRWLLRAGRAGRYALPARETSGAGAAPGRPSPEAGLPLSELAGRIAASGELWVEATGWSMWPTIPPDARVLVAPLQRDPRPGDIVLVAHATAPVLHRVASVGEGWVRTIGDSQVAADPPMRREAVLAHALASEHGARIAALAPTLRFGTRALLRYGHACVRLRAARAWRHALRRLGA